MNQTREYFIVANSFAAPFFSDDSTKYVQAASPAAALRQFAKDYKHPAGLYAALCFESADAYHKNTSPLAKWLCNHELAKMRLTAKKDGYSYIGHSPGSFEIDGRAHTVDNPKEGKVVEVRDGAEGAKCAD